MPGTSISSSTDAARNASSEPKRFSSSCRRFGPTPGTASSICLLYTSLLVEFHPDPATALSDGDQALPLTAMPAFQAQVRRVARALGRDLR